MPLWVRSVERQIITMQDIERWRQFDTQTDLLSSYLPYYLNLESKKGPGYFKLNEVVTLENEKVKSTRPDQNEEPADNNAGNNRENKFKLKYDFSFASVIPIPTIIFTPTIYNSNNFQLSEGASRQTEIVRDISAKCHTYSDPLDPNSNPHNAYPSCDFSYDSNKKRIVYSPEDNGADPSNDIKMFYTVPALGTGNANNETCTPFQLNLTDTYTYNGQTYPIDPLEHPCNWNWIEKNETVAIPLFTRVDDPDNEGQTLIRYQKPELLSLRLRYPCLNTSGYCHPEERLELKIPESVTNRDIMKPDGIDLWEFRREVDDSPRLIDYSIVDWTPNNQQYYRPFSETILNSYCNNGSCVNTHTKAFVRRRALNWYIPRIQDVFNNPSNGIYRSYDISQLGQSFRTNSNKELLNIYDTETSTSYFNFTGGLFNTDELRIETEQQANIKWEKLGTNKSTTFFIFAPDTPNTQIYPDNLKHPNLTSNIDGELLVQEQNPGELPELYLVIKLEGFDLKSEPIAHNGNPANEKQINRIQWQVISDKPLGNHKAQVTGSIFHPNAGWQTNDPRFIYAKNPTNNQAPKDTGVVFSN